MRLNSMRTRMTFAFALSTALLMAIGCVVILRYAVHSAERTAKRLLLATARKIHEDLTDDERRVKITEIVEEERQTLQPSNMALVVENGEGVPLYWSQPDVHKLPYHSNDAWRIAAIPFAPYRILVGMPWNKTVAALHRQGVLLILLGLFVTGVATIGAWLLVGRTLSPIGALARQARSAATDSLQVRLNASSEDAEIVDLVSTLNGMLVRIADTVATKGRFHAAASHELRTPLQGLSGHLQLALNRDRSAAEYRVFIEEANSYAQKLTELTHDLLLLHQLDASAPAGKSEVDLADICERTLRNLAARIQERGMTAAIRMPDDAHILAAPTHAEMLVRNLIDNAVKYGTQEGPLTVQISDSPGIELTVFNACPPLSQGDMNRLFEPFYRPDRARNSSTGGTGLGLAISKAIADANGWKLTLTQANGGFLATVGFNSP